MPLEMGVQWDIAINQLSIIDLLYLHLSRSPVALVSLRRLKIVDRGVQDSVVLPAQDAHAHFLHSVLKAKFVSLKSTSYSCASLVAQL